MAGNETRSGWFCDRSSASGWLNTDLDWPKSFSSRWLTCLRSFTCLLLFAALSGCGATVPQRTTVKTYDVFGASGPELLKSIENRRLRAGGPTVSATLDIRFAHSFRTVQQTDQCRYTRDGRVGLLSDVLTPEWRSRDLAPPELQRAWDQYRREEQIFVARRVAIYRKFAIRLETEFRNASAPDCRRLEVQMNRFIETLGEELTTDIYALVSRTAPLDQARVANR